MSESTYTIDLPFSIARLWEIFNTVEQWAPLLENYVSHETISATESIWTFKITIGVMKKKVSTKIKIVEWEEPTKITLYVTGVNEKFNGHGYIETADHGEGMTAVMISQNITVKGALKVMANTLTKAPSTKKLKKITEDTTKKLIEIENLLKKANVLVD